MKTSEASGTSNATTSNFDEETIYYIYRIQIELLEKYNIIIFNPKKIIDHILQEAFKIKNTINYSNKDFIQNIHIQYEKVIITYNNSEINKLFIDEINNNLKTFFPNVNFKKNQIIKSVIVFYYKHLINLNQ